jgi:hypothetical protein
VRATAHSLHPSHTPAPGCPHHAGSPSPAASTSATLTWTTWQQQCAGCWARPARPAGARVSWCVCCAARCHMTCRVPPGLQLHTPAHTLLVADAKPHACMPAHRYMLMSGPPPSMLQIAHLLRLAHPQVSRASYACAAPAHSCVCCTPASTSSPAASVQLSCAADADADAAAPATHDARRRPWRG